MYRSEDGVLFFSSCMFGVIFSVCLFEPAEDVFMFRHTERFLVSKGCYMATFFSSKTQACNVSYKMMLEVIFSIMIPKNEC